MLILISALMHSYYFVQVVPVFTMPCFMLALFMHHLLLIYHIIIKISLPSLMSLPPPNTTLISESVTLYIRNTYCCPFLQMVITSFTKSALHMSSSVLLIDLLSIHSQNCSMSTAPFNLPHKAVLAREQSIRKSASGKFLVLVSIGKFWKCIQNTYSNQNRTNKRGLLLLKNMCLMLGWPWQGMRWLPNCSHILHPPPILLRKTQGEKIWPKTVILKSSYKRQLVVVAAFTSPSFNLRKDLWVVVSTFITDNL